MPFFHLRTQPRMPPRITRAALLLALLAYPAGPLSSQQPEAEEDGGGRVRTLPSLGGMDDERARVAHLLSSAPTGGYLLRSPSSELRRARAGEGPRQWALLAPELLTTWNSALPFAANDGALRGGRGLSARVRGGAWARWGRISLLLAPELRYEQNREFSLPDFGSQPRNGASAPWYSGARSADLPLRFADAEGARVGPGQSTLAVTVGGVDVGASTENQWWGPGIRNAIVMSDHAPGFPHLFLRTTAPLRTGIGSFEGKWIVGRLSESESFDTVAANDVRALSGAALVYHPAGEPGLALGIARTVQAPVSGTGAVPARAGDVLTRWGTEAALDSAGGQGSDQLLSVFARWVFPEDGLEVYAEWARQALSGSFVDFLDSPGASQAYTLGVQGARPVGEAGALRLQAEVTYLEQTPRAEPTRSFYVSPVVPQGYTHRGQVIGASIGPGASSQWIAADYLAPRWHAGAFGGRIRWDNDAYLTTARARIMPWPWLGHDVSLFGGVRGGYTLPGVRVDAELATGVRYNFLFQNRGESWETADDAEDVRNHTLRLTITPVGRR